MIVRRALFLLFAAVAGCHGDNSNTGPDVPANCSLPISPAALPDAQVQSLGTKKVGSVVTFNVPAGTQSVTILQQAKSANLTITYQGSVLDNSAVPATITMPDGTKAYDDNWPVCPAPDGGTPANCNDPEQQLGFFGGGSPVTAEFTYPNTAAALTKGVPSGQWQFVVNDYAYECSAGGCQDGGTDQNTYDVSVLTKPAPGAAMDVAFYIVGTATGSLGTLTASTAPNEPAVKRMLNVFKTLFSNAGVTVRNVSFYDVSDSDKQRFGTTINADQTGPCDELSQMFLLSNAHPGNVMNLFLVQDIRSTPNGGGSVVGLDGSIPGPATLSGTVHSGAAVSMANLFSVSSANPTACSSSSMNLNCGADSVAYVAAHETGHFLGLFHTTEREGDFFDTLGDTPKCACQTCSSASDRPNCGSTTNSSVVLKATLCNSGSCAGGTNLMFWQLDASVSAGLLSTQQGQVMKQSPLIQ